MTGFEASQASPLPAIIYFVSHSWSHGFDIAVEMFMASLSTAKNLKHVCGQLLTVTIHINQYVPTTIDRNV